MARLEWDELAWQRQFRDPAGPVMADMLPRIGAGVLAAAEARFHRRTGKTAGSLHWKVGSDSSGPFVDIGGSYVIRFLEKPAEQMREPHRWLSDAAREVAGQGG
jgi:hypothetical protein